MKAPVVVAAPATPFWDDFARELGARLDGRCHHWTPGGGQDFPEDADAIVWRPSAKRSGLVEVSQLEALRQRLPGKRPPRVVMLSSTQVYAPSHHHRGYVGEAELSATDNRVALSWRRAEKDFWAWAAGRSSGEPPIDFAGSTREDRSDGGNADGSVRAPGKDNAVGSPGRDEADRSVRAPGGDDAGIDWARPVVLRCAEMPASGEGFFWRLFKGRVAVVPFGYDPTLQFLALEDLLGATVRALSVEGGGVFNIVPRESIPLRQSLRLCGVRRLGIFSVLQRVVRPAPAALGLAASFDQLRYLRYPWTASGRRAREVLGFEAAPVQAYPPQAPGREPGFLGQRHFDLRPSHDPFGMDPDYIAAYGRTLHRFWHDWYWRIEVRGLEHIPAAGRAVLVGIHRGFMPFDGTMLLDAVFQGTGRIPRFLVHPTLVKFPCLANYMTKLGGIHACRENADWVLRSDEILGMYPEGIRGAFTMYRKAYRLGSFGRDEFVRMALRNRAPLIPVVTVGSAEIFPILGRIRWRWFSRFTEWPFLPITPTFPLLPLPLPSKWHTQFLEPLHIERDYPPEAADDREAIRSISREVRRRMSEAIQRMLAARPSTWRGNIWE